MNINVVISMFTAIDDVALSVALQTDNKIVVAGHSGIVGNSAVIVARYHSDGTIDTNFGGLGDVVTSIGPYSGGHATVIQPDGKIVVAGASSTDHLGNEDFAVLRYNEDGMLDNTFFKA